MVSRVRELMDKVRNYEAHHTCDSSSCEHDKQNARSTGESTLSVFRSVTDLETEQLVETLHGITLWTEALLEYNETLKGMPGQEGEQFNLADMQNAARAAMFVLGEELIALQDMNVIPQE